MSQRDKELKQILEGLTAIQARLSENMEAFAKKFGLSVSDFLILSDIKNHPGTTMHELCERAGLKKSSVSRIIDDMVKQNFVVRTIPPGDRRTVRLSFTRSFAEGGFCATNNLDSMFKGIGEFKNANDLVLLFDHLSQVHRLISGESLPESAGQRPNDPEETKY